MVSKVINYGTLFKWIAIAIVAYFIWSCIRQDSANYRAEKFQTISIEHKPGPSVQKVSEPTESASTVASEAAHPVCSGKRQGTCGGDGGCITKSGTRLLPVLDPCFNMREICKQCVLLEDHLFQTEKRCEDCIRKHFLTIEGLAEEAITLDKENKYKFSKLELPEKIRKLEKEFVQSKDPEEIAQQLRQIRKPLMNKYFDSF